MSSPSTSPPGVQRWRFPDSQSAPVGSYSHSWTHHTEAWALPLPCDIIHDTEQLVHEAIWRPGPPPSLRQASPRSPGRLFSSLSHPGLPSTPSAFGNDSAFAGCHRVEHEEAQAVTQVALSCPSRCYPSPSHQPPALYVKFKGHK